MFSAGSTNDGTHKELWIKSASLFINQINMLLQHTSYNFKILNIEEFYNYECHNLGNILEQHKSDKSTWHNYHYFYSVMFQQLGKDSNLNVLEIGLGTNNPTLVSTMGIHGRPGASLYAFREYLPNSNIYGVDIDKTILFETDKIKTCYVDQLDIKTFDEMSKNFGNIKFDVIIDDGLHSIGANLNTLLFALNNLNDNGWIVIEDIHIINNWKSIDFILSSNVNFKTYIITAKYGHLYAIHKL
jgi:hypothetical protein